MRPPLDATGILKGVVGQAAGKLPYATTLWLLDAVARHATAASSDFFCVPVRGARQRARLPTVQTTPPADPGALYGAFAPQAATRTREQHTDDILMTCCMSVGGPVLSGNMGTRPAHVYYMYIGKSARVRADKYIFLAHKRARRPLFFFRRACQSF